MKVVERSKRSKSVDEVVETETNFEYGRQGSYGSSKLSLNGDQDQKNEKIEVLVDD